MKEDRYERMVIFVGLVFLIFVLGTMVIKGHARILDRLTAIEQRMDT